MTKENQKLVRVWAKHLNISTEGKTIEQIHNEVWMERERRAAESFNQPTQYEVCHFDEPTGEYFVWYKIPHPKNPKAGFICRRNDLTFHGWQHVSVVKYYGKKSVTPTWDDICFIKSIFWTPETRIIEIHPPRSEYVNNHPNCLHLWRYTFDELPAPPFKFLGDPGTENPNHKSPLMKRLRKAVRKGNVYPTETLQF